jgi:hypothetical protein
MIMATERFKHAIADYIAKHNDKIKILKEKPVGYRFVKTPRYLDIILQYEGKYLGIEAKYQESAGTAYQKLSYTLDDCKVSPIPTIIVFAGPEIKDDIKSKLITSGYGLELEFKADASDPSKDEIIDKNNLLLQRVYIELGLDWFGLFKKT